MISGFMDTFNEMEIYLLTLLINKIKSDTIIDYWFDKEMVNKLVKCYSLKASCVDSLIYKNIIKSDIVKTCRACGDQLDLCECEIKDIVAKEYFSINIEKFIEYFTTTFAQYYGVKIEKSLQTSDFLWVYNISDVETEVQISFRNLHDEFSKNVKVENKLIISVMPLSIKYDNFSIFEWHEVLDKDNIDKLKIKLKDLYNNFNSRNLYYLDMGDDCSIDEVENIRAILRKYLINNGYKNYTENIKYKPEYIEYNFPIDKIKECFILDDNKIFVLKPSEKEISVAYFKNGIIGRDDKTHELLYKFDCFMKKRIEKLRKIKFSEVKSDKMHKFIEICGPAINICVVIFSVLSKNTIFKNIVSIFDGGKEWFWYIYIIINVIYLIFIIMYSIIPAFQRIIFRWELGLNKVK